MHALIPGNKPQEQTETKKTKKTEKKKKKKGSKPPLFYPPKTEADAKNIGRIALGIPEYFFGRTCPPSSMFADQRPPPRFNEARYPCSGPQLPSLHQPEIKPHPDRFRLMNLVNAFPIADIPTTAEEAHSVWEQEQERSKHIVVVVKKILNCQPPPSMTLLQQVHAVAEKDQQRMAIVRERLHASKFMTAKPSTGFLDGAAKV
jgi:hypothetical protein